MGVAEVVIQKGEQRSDPQGIEVLSIATGLFSHPVGGDPAIAIALTVHADGSRTQELTYDPATGQYQAVAITEGEEIYLLLFGTGIRGHGGVASATVGGAAVPVLAAVTQGEFVGIDQVNIGPLPPSLEGTGLAQVIVTVDGVGSNAVTINLAE